MKNLILCTLLSVVCMMASCSDDDASAMKPMLPSGNASRVLAINHEGNITESYDWTFTYKNHRLTEASGIYRSSITEDDKTRSYKSKISYNSNSIKVKNEGAGAAIVELDGNNRIEKIKTSDMTQTFHYQYDVLKGWTKTFYGNSHGHVDELTTSAEFDYEGGDFKTITYKKEGEITCIVSLNPSQHTNANGLLPETISSELGLIGIEHYYYAGLMGRSTNHLVQSISVDYPKNPELNRTTTFEYSHANGNTTSCNYSFQDQASSVRYTY